MLPIFVHSAIIRKTIPHNKSVKKTPTNTRPKNAISLHPLTPAQAIAAALRVNPADVRALEEKERAAKSRKK